MRHLIIGGGPAGVTAAETLRKADPAGEITVVESAQEGGAYVRFSGFIEALPAQGVTGEWTVSGQKIIVSAQTQLLGAAPAVGKPVGVEGVKRVSDGAIVATSVRVRFLPPNAPTAMPTGTVVPPVRPTRTPRP